MPVAIANAIHRWPGGTIKYNPQPEGADVSRESLHEMVSAFNEQVGYPIWFPANEGFDITFAFGIQSESPMGRNSGSKQRVRVKVGNDKNGKPEIHSIFHEMCHAIGLGHENFHTGFPWRNQLMTQAAQVDGIPENKRSIEDKRIKAAVGKFNLYMDIGPYNSESIMLYGPSSFGVSNASYIVNKRKLYLSEGDKQGILLLMPGLRPQQGSLLYRKWSC